MSTRFQRHVCTFFQTVNKYHRRQISASSVYGFRWSDATNQPVSSPPRGACLLSLPGLRKYQQLSLKRWASTHLVDVKTSMYLGVAGIQELEDFTPLSDEELQQDVTTKINTSLMSGDAGRLFAVVQVRGKQFKVSAEDLIVVQYDFPPNVGDRIRLEKVLAAGGKDFTLLGQPLLSRDVVRVEATVVEKTLSHNKVWFVYRRKCGGFKKFHLNRDSLTVLVINSVQVVPQPDTGDDSKEGTDSKP